MGDQRNAGLKAWDTIRKCRELALQAASAGQPRPTQLVNGCAITDAQWAWACKKAKTKIAPHQPTVETPHEPAGEISIKPTAVQKARAAEAASKEALRIYCQEHRWKVAFFEGPTGSPRTGIIDAIAFRLGRTNADALDLRLIQLKGGNAGISGPEIARLKKAASGVIVKWLIAAYDGETLHVVPDDSEV